MNKSEKLVQYCADNECPTHNNCDLCMYEKGRVEGIDEYSNELFKVIEKATVNCKLDFTIYELRQLEVIIKGLAEEMKEQEYDK